MKLISFLILMVFCLSCSKTEELTSDPTKPLNDGPCPSSIFPDWSTSDYVLPYTVGKSYLIGLNACSSSFHAVGQPDQFAIDFNMPIGSEVRASVAGTVVHVEESGEDFGNPNNLVVIFNGSEYAQYMHLTKNGAVVEVDDDVNKGDLIGYSGVTGLAGYPHLHLVVTTEAGWEYPYVSTPITFSNTLENPRSLESGESYLALEY